MSSLETYENLVKGQDKIMSEIKFEIKQHIGILSESPKGWHKELNLISWNGKAPKFDLRDWSPEHEKMGKGVTLTNEEVKKLQQILAAL